MMTDNDNVDDDVDEDSVCVAVAASAIVEVKKQSSPEARGKLQKYLPQEKHGHWRRWLA